MGCKPKNFFWRCGSAALTTGSLLSGVLGTWAGDRPVQAAEDVTVEDLEKKAVEVEAVARGDNEQQAIAPPQSFDRHPVLENWRHFSQATPDASDSVPQTPTPAQFSDSVSPAEVPPAEAPPAEEQSPAETPQEEAMPEEQSFFVRDVVVVGSTILEEAEINAIVSPFEGREVSLTELRGIAESITQIYLERDFITSRAILPDQVIEGDTVTIQVIEGRLETIEIEGDRRVNASYVRSRVAAGAGIPLNTRNLEERLRLLRADPLFENIEASLRRGTQPGASILTVRVTEAKPWEVGVSADNFSPPSVGAERFGAFARYRSLTGLGDDLSVSYFFTLDNGSDVYDINYRVPLNPMNGALQLRVAPSRNEIIQEPFDEFGIRGDRELYEVSFRQPLVLSPREEFALSLAFTHQEGQTFTFFGPTPFGIGPDEDGVSRTSVVRFSQDYIRREAAGAWVLRSQFNFGTGLFDATINDSPVPDGRFFSWTFQTQRLQRFGRDNLLIVQGDLQLSPNSLLPSDQFVIGGGTSLRGYRQNIRSGDNGFRFSVESRFTVARDAAGVPKAYLAPFFDMGTVWNVDGNPNQLPDQTFLLGAGLAAFWEPFPGLRLRVDYAVPFIDLDDRGDNLQDDGLYFNVNFRL